MLQRVFCSPLKCAQCQSRPAAAPLRQLEILHRNKPCSVHCVCLSMTTKTYSKLTLDLPREQACNYTIVLLHGLQKKMKLTINQYTVIHYLRTPKLHQNGDFLHFSMGNNESCGLRKILGPFSWLVLYPQLVPFHKRSNFWLLGRWRTTRVQGQSHGEGSGEKCVRLAKVCGKYAKMIWMCDFLKLLYCIKSIQFVYVIFFASKGIEQFSMLGWGRENLTFQGAVFLSAQTLTFLLSQKSRNVNEVHILASIPIMAQTERCFVMLSLEKKVTSAFFGTFTLTHYTQVILGDFCCFPLENFMFF